MIKMGKPSRIKGSSKSFQTMMIKIVKITNQVIMKTKKKKMIMLSNFMMKRGNLSGKPKAVVMKMLMETKMEVIMMYRKKELSNQMTKVMRMTLGKLITKGKIMIQCGLLKTKKLNKKRMINQFR